MNISKQEAQESLAGIDDVISQTQKEIACSANYHTLILWGVIWLVGFSVTQFFPQKAGPVWLVLNLIGWVVTWMIVKSSKFQRPTARRVHLAWLIVCGYLVLWSFLLHPSGREAMAFSVTVCMCGYVICGLWLGRFWIWLGVIVTALTVAGHFLFPAWFPLWIGITGGGALIISGLFIRKFWK